MPLDTSFRVRAGQVLGFDFIRAGARGYLAIDGGIAVPEVLAAVRPTVWGDRWLAGTATGGGRPAAPGTASPSAVEGLRAAFVAGGGRWRGELAGGSRALRSSPDPRRGRAFLRRDLDRRLGGGPHRLPLQGRHGAPVRAARTAIRRRLGPVQHRRRLLSHRLDPGTGRARTHRPASRCGVRWGYATLGTVISPDLNRLAQMQPNQKARFVAVSLEEGLEARRRYNWQVQRLQHFFLR